MVFTEQLRSWFQGRRRDLPWRVADMRGLRNPYRTWISEIMLQQTRVEAVVPYFENFLQQFPAVGDLAAASEEQVLKAWAGLGYYRRARFLHAAAKQLVDDFAGEFPNTAVGLKELPGIGAYTSAAIASLAFGERVPVVDGNVKRVVSRWAALELASDAPALHKASEQQGALWMLELSAGDLVAAGETNEALMELGATVCLPRNPSCEACPVMDSCQAKAVGRVAELPLAKKAKKWVDLEMVFLVHRVGERVILMQQEGGWSPGLFEPPSKTLAPGESTEIALKILQGELSADAAAHGTVRHTITHHRIRAHVFATQGPSRKNESHLRHPEEVPLTGLARKVLRRALE